MQPVLQSVTAIVVMIVFILFFMWIAKSTKNVEKKFMWIGFGFVAYLITSLCVVFSTELLGIQNVVGMEKIYWNALQISVGMTLSIVLMCWRVRLNDPLTFRSILLFVSGSTLLYFLASIIVLLSVPGDFLFSLDYMLSRFLEFTVFVLAVTWVSEMWKAKRLPLGIVFSVGGIFIYFALPALVHGMGGQVVSIVVRTLWVLSLSAVTFRKVEENK